jgi:hypothetical protein
MAEIRLLLAETLGWMCLFYAGLGLLLIWRQHRRELRLQAWVRRRERLRRRLGE